jgi:glycosyltransferase involved in cell wall biosynthesis
MLSIIINVKNGARYLARCLDSVSEFDDIVVLDNYSSDNTKEIAQHYTNVRFFEVEFCGMGKLRNLAASYACNDWLFILDSDEVMSPQLRDAIKATNLSDPNRVYRVKRMNYYAGQLVDGASWDNDWVSRIYNRTVTKYNQVTVHESIITDGMEIQSISSGILYHFPYDNVSQLINKMQTYSTWYATQNVGKKKPKLFATIIRTGFTFLKCYILKGGFKYGFAGFVISSYNALGVFSKYIKLYELTNQVNCGLALYISSSVSNEQLSELIDKINQQTLLPSKVYMIAPDNSNKLILEQKLKNLECQSVVPIKAILKNNYDFDHINVVFELRDYISGKSAIMLNSNYMLKLRHGYQRRKTIAGVSFVDTSNQITNEA